MIISDDSILQNVSSKNLLHKYFNKKISSRKISNVWRYVYDIIIIIDINRYIKLFIIYN